MPFLPDNFLTNCNGNTEFYQHVLISYPGNPPRAVSPDLNTTKEFDYLTAKTYDDLRQHCYGASNLVNRPRSHASVAGPSGGTWKPARQFTVLWRAYCYSVAKYVYDGLLPEPPTGVTASGTQPHAYRTAAEILGIVGLVRPPNVSPAQHVSDFYGAILRVDLNDWLYQHFV